MESSNACTRQKRNKPGHQDKEKFAFIHISIARINRRVCVCLLCDLKYYAKDNSSRTMPVYKLKVLGMPPPHIVMSREFASQPHAVCLCKRANDRPCRKYIIDIVVYDRDNHTAHTAHIH